MKTQDWKSVVNEPRALLIGHDPRLQKSDTQAEFVLFANYFFDKTIKDRSFKSKYGLAASAFNQITHITKAKIKPEEIYITNLCNSALPHAPKGKTVFIPEIKAKEGLENIRRIISENPGIEYIFPMSLQVNYWLQKLGFYNSLDNFVAMSEPLSIGVLNKQPYYKPTKDRTFLLICGNKYRIDGSKQTVIPILHSRCFPLNDTFKAYAPSYEKLMHSFI